MDNDPPATAYATREAAQEAAQQWAKSQSFAIVFGRTRTSKKASDADQPYKQWLNCSKHGIFKSESHGKREVFTGKTDCKWQAQLIRELGTSLWKIEGIYACSRRSTV